MILLLDCWAIVVLHTCLHVLLNKICTLKCLPMKIKQQQTLNYLHIKPVIYYLELSPLQYLRTPVDRMRLFRRGVILAVYLDSLVSLRGDESGP